MKRIIRTVISFFLIASMFASPVLAAQEEEPLKEEALYEPESVPMQEEAVSFEEEKDGGLQLDGPIKYVPLIALCAIIIAVKRIRRTA